MSQATDGISYDVYNIEVNYSRLHSGYAVKRVSCSNGLNK